MSRVYSMQSYGGKGNKITFVQTITLVALVMKNLSASGDIRNQVLSLGWENPMEVGMTTHSSILTWRIHMARGAWQATVHEVAKSWT